MRIPTTWLNQFLSVPVPLDELTEALTMGIAEVESRETVDGDEVLELELKPDRGDCLCVEGVAREVAALAQVAFQEPAFISPRSAWTVERSQPGENSASAAGVPIRIAAPDLCPRYAACVMDTVQVGRSPEWLQRRIRQVGLRPVNNVVDATNFVMFEMGQPLHAFDLDRLSGPAIIVRRAAEGEQLKAINGEEYALTSDTLVIADAERPVAVAGVMGGLESEVSERTTRIVLESAHFNPVSVRMTARALDLRSDASYRFERTVDPDGCIRALARVASIIEDIAGGRVNGPVADVYPTPILERSIRLRPDRVRSLLGMNVSGEQIEQSLRRLALSAAWDGDELVVTVPTRRADLAIEEDLIEEVARMIGYDKVPAVLPVATSTPGGLIPERKVADMVRDALVGTGFTEIRSYSLAGAASLRRAGCLESAAILRNPTSADRDLLRPSILPSLIDAAETNLGLGFRDQHLFEVGRVFVGSDGTPGVVESTHVAGLALGSAWGSAWNLAPDSVRSDFYSVQGVLDNLASTLRIRFEMQAPGSEGSVPAGAILPSVGVLHPGRTAVVYLQDGAAIGFLGEMHPQLAAQIGFPSPPILFELSAAPLVEAYAAGSRRPVDMEFHRHPPATRDLAVAISRDVPAAQVLQIVCETSPLITEARIFDVYRGAGLDPDEQSIAISFVLRAPGRTMIDTEANGIVDSAAAVLAERFGARRR